MLYTHLVVYRRGIRTTRVLELEIYIERLSAVRYENERNK